MKIEFSNMFYVFIFAILEVIILISYKFALMNHYINANLKYFLGFRFFELICVFFFGFFLVRYLCEKSIINPRFFYRWKLITRSLFIAFVAEIMFFEVIAANIHRGISPIIPKILEHDIWFLVTFLLGISCSYFFKPKLRIIK